MRDSSVEGMAVNLATIANHLLSPRQLQLVFALLSDKTITRGEIFVLWYGFNPSSRVEKVKKQHVLATQVAKINRRLNPFGARVVKLASRGDSAPYCLRFDAKK